MRRFALVFSITLVTAAAVAAAFVWWRLQPPRAGRLDADWQARVLVIAGDGIHGWRDGAAVRARFSEPFGIAALPDGTLYVTDAGEAHRIRRISADGRVETLAGGEAGFADGAGASARFSTPSGVAVDADGTVYVADTGNHAIRRVTADGTVSTLAGDGIAGHVDGPGPWARFNGPVGVAVDPSGRVIVADTYNDRIRVVERDGTVRTLAGADEPGMVDGFAAAARFDTPSGVAVDASGTVHVADTGNGALRTIDATGLVTTPGWSHAEGVFRPVGIAANASGDLYVTDEGGRIVEIRVDGATRTVAGSIPGFRDGDGREARFRNPAGVAVVEPGRLVVADAGNALVRLVTAGSPLGLPLPARPGINPHFDAAAFDWQPLLWPVAPYAGPHEIAGTFGEARGAGGDRFHRGVDVRIEQGTLVRAVRDGIVSGPIANDAVGLLDEWLRVGPLTYVHIRAGRSRDDTLLDPSRFVATYVDGRLRRLRVKRGARFAAGDVLGTVNAFNHVHLNVGWPGEEHNPLQFRLAHFEDTVPPTITRGGVRVYDEQWRELTTRSRRRLLVTGRVRIVVDAFDQADGNVPWRRLGLYDLGYQILDGSGTPAAGFDTIRHTLRFNRMGPDSSAARLVHGGGSGIPFYGGGRTRFLYIVTNTFRDGLAAEGFWDTTRLPPGDYIVRVRAADIRGNVATANRDLPVTILPPAN